ncbi:MAG: UbiA prenyltransferase family protein [Desulfobaccales bacterium]
MSLIPLLPFLLAGCLPLWVGALLAGVSGLPVHPGVLGISTLAVAALMLAAFCAREIFYPGVGRCPAWSLRTARPPQTAAYEALGVAALMGLALQFGWRTGAFTIPLGALGLLGGYFSFAPPLAWHRRGLGEVAGALCFGLLPVATGLYLQCSQLLTELLFYGLPLTFTGFNLFLMYGFPGPGDKAPPRTLAARVQPLTAALLYTIFNVLTIFMLMVTLIFPASALPWRFGLVPLAILAVINQELIKRKAYLQEGRLQLVAKLTLTLHVGMGLVFVMMLWQRL